MGISHPLNFLSPGQRKPVFFAALLLTAACVAVFQIFLDPPLVSTGSTTGSTGSTGIVSFELAGSADVSTAMVSSWDARARNFAAFGLGFDFLFMPVYATALSAGLLLAAGRRRGVWPALGNFLGWGAYAATVFDAVENIALFSILNESVGINPQIAFWCACLKFGLLLAGVVYGLLGWLLPER